VTANQAGDAAENEGNADSERAQAGVFDTDSSNEADDSRDFAPVVAKPAVVQPVETAQAVQAPVQEPAHAVTVEPVSAAAISVTELPEPVRVTQVAPVEAVPVEAKRAEAEGFVVSHGAQEVHAAQQTKATVAEAPATDIFEKPVSRPIENPFGPTPKLAEEKVESPFADTPKAAEPAPVVAHAAPEAEIAEPVKMAPVAATPESDLISSIASPAPVVAEASAPVESEPVKTFEPVETVAPAAPAPVAAALAAPVAPVAAVPLKEEALKPMLDTAGLVWVNTDADKLRAAREAAAQAEAPKRVVRERKRLPPLDAAPMQQVETGKDAH
jgi:ribonuclease E